MSWKVINWMFFPESVWFHIQFFYIFTSCFNWIVSAERQEHDHHFCFVSIDHLSLNSASARQMPKRLPLFYLKLLLFDTRFIIQVNTESIMSETPTGFNPIKSIPFFRIDFNNQFQLNILMMISAIGIIGKIELISVIWFE